MFFFYPTDIYYLILVIPAVLIALWAEINVKSSFSRYNAVMNRRGLTGAMVARQILDENGLRNIRVELTSGHLSDHYDPRAGVIRLSQSVYNSQSIGAIGVAAHEVGHAVQHATGYAPLKLRNAIIPITSIGSNLAMPLAIFGLIFNWRPLFFAGIILFGVVVFFQLVTLPVEFNASSRALATLRSDGMLDESELIGAGKVLRAAALTYVAALLVALANLLRLLLLALSRGRRND